MKLYGLLGRNISYSLSPAMHNVAFKELHMEAEYKVFDMAEERLGGFFSKLKAGEVSGCNVTIPYKEETLEFMDKLDDVAKNIGAVNTVVERKGALYGYNTDCQAFIEALTGSAEGDLKFKAEGKSVFIFGAGGASKAIIYALSILGVKKIAITDIDMERAEGLANLATENQKGNAIMTVVEDSGQYEEFISKADLLVNATPCGMKPNDSPLFDYKYIHDELSVFDLVYTKETPLIKQARSLGANATSGVNMLLYQAAASFAIWTARKAPVGVMREALLKKI